MRADKHVTTIADVPTVEHWAIFKTNSVFIPGDERSRTNPGHGYPAETRHFIAYEAYLTEEKLLQAIKELEEPRYGGRNEYRVAKIVPMKIKKEMSITIE
jgi:hypothetical protein